MDEATVNREHVVECSATANGVISSNSNAGTSARRRHVNPGARAEVVTDHIDVAESCVSYAVSRSRRLEVEPLDGHRPWKVSGQIKAARIGCTDDAVSWSARVTRE